MKLRYNSNINGDYTQGFTVEDYQEKLCDFIAEALDQFPTSSGHFEVNFTRIAFQKGKLTGRIPEKYRNASVISARGTDEISNLYFKIRTDNHPYIFKIQ